MCTYVYQESVAEEEKATEILDQKIRDLERDIAQQRKHMGGFVTMTPFKQINILDNNNNRIRSGLKTCKKFALLTEHNLIILTTCVFSEKNEHNIN